MVPAVAAPTQVGVETNGKKEKELDHSAVLCGMVSTIPQYCD